MLSPNTLLSKGRYRVDRWLRGTPTWVLYVATDLEASRSVLVIERPGLAPGQHRAAHEGLVSVENQFTMNGRVYEVTEPIRLDDAERPEAAFDRFAVILMALNSLAASRSGPSEIGPDMVVPAADGRYKLISLEAQTGGIEIDAWHLPLEAVWDELDHISQKAIYNGWDEGSVAALEMPRDERSDLYSLAAVFYKILTATPPPSAFERIVVGLDDKDPLAEPASLKAGLESDASAFLLRCLDLRRERRFASFENAILNLPANDPVISEANAEEIDLLELGTKHHQSPAERMPTPATPAVIAKVETAERFVSVAEVKNIREVAEVPTETKDQLPTYSISDHAPIFAVEARPRRRLGLVGAFAAITVTVVGGGTWGFMQYSSSSAAASPSSAQPPVAELAAERPEPAPTVAPEPEVGTDTVTSPGAESEPAVQTSSARPQTAQVRQPAKPASKPAADTKPKKKLTVDDLISDN